MFAIRATAKVLKRGAPKELEPAQPTTVLGDWYANVLVVRPEHLILAVSERTMLPVVVTAKNVSRLPQRIAQAAQEVLLGIGVEPSLIAREIEEMQVACFAKTENRSLLGGLNDFMFHLEHAYHHHPEFDLHGLAMWLAKTPTGVIKDIFPFKAALAAFESSAGLRRPKSAV